MAEDKKLYAWSNILAGDKVIKCGDVVTAQAVGGAEELSVLRDAGAVRSEPYPVPEAEMDLTPATTYKLRKIREDLESMGKSIEDLD